MATSEVRRSQAVRLLALRTELRGARECQLEYLELRQRLEPWTLDQVQAVILWDKLKRKLAGNAGLDKWELAVLHEERRKRDPVHQKAMQAVRRQAMNPSTSKMTRKRVAGTLYRLTQDLRYAPPGRYPVQIERDIVALRREANPEAHARRLKRRAKERTAQRKASGESARRAQAKVDIAETYAQLARPVAVAVKVGVNRTRPGLAA